MTFFKLKKTIFVLALILTLITFPQKSFAGLAAACLTYNGACAPTMSACSQACAGVSLVQKGITIPFINLQFNLHTQWLTKIFFEQHLLPAMMLFAEQMTAAAMSQVVTIGMMLDAKHQLETQRLFQQLTAQAHKDYQPSEGMCTFGTGVRSLAASERNTELTAAALSSRMLQRELLSGDNLSGGGETTDSLSRIKQFREIYCTPGDNGNGLHLLCPNASPDVSRVNRDINYTDLVETPMTLRLDFAPTGNGDHTARGASPEEEDLLALSANLYAHEAAPQVSTAFLASGARQGAQGDYIASGASQYLDIRAIAAKRSVARNSFAAISAMKSQGEAGVQPYLYALIKEMGIQDPGEIQKYLGARPSYFAQMEVLTKKLYQNPLFYTELVDKPANVDRKMVAMQAIELMQKRDIYRSILRSEATISVMLETALIERQEKVDNELNQLRNDELPMLIPD